MAPVTVSLAGSIGGAAAGGMAGGSLGSDGGGGSGVADRASPRRGGASLRSSRSDHLALDTEVGGLAGIGGGGLRSSNFELPQELDDRTVAGVAEVTQLMHREGLSFDEARLQLVLRRMGEMGVDSSGMPTDPKTFTFDQVRAQGAVPTKPWRQAVPESRRGCTSRFSLAEPPSITAAMDTPKGAVSLAVRGFHVLQQWDLCGCLPPDITLPAALKAIKSLGPTTCMLLRVLLLGLAALLMVILGSREQGASALPGFLVQDTAMDDQPP